MIDVHGAIVTSAIIDIGASHEIRLHDVLNNVLFINVIAIRNRWFLLTI